MKDTNKISDDIYNIVAKVIRETGKMFPIHIPAAYQNGIASRVSHNVVEYICKMEEEK